MGYRPPDSANAVAGSFARVFAVSTASPSLVRPRRAAPSSLVIFVEESASASSVSTCLSLVASSMPSSSYLQFRSAVSASWSSATVTWVFS